MYTRLANRLALATVPAFWILIPGPPAIVVRHSSPVSMEGANAVQFDATVINISSTNGLDISLQGSNDLENWEEIVTPFFANAPGYTLTAPQLNIDYAYVRLEYKMWQTEEEYSLSPAYAILSAGMDVFAE